MGSEKMIRFLSGFVLPLALLVSCNSIVEKNPPPEKPNYAPAPVSNPTPTEQIPKDGLKASGDGEEARVLWQVSGFVPGPKAAMDRGEADKMLAKPLDISGDRIVFDGKACEGVKFKSTNEPLGKYLKGVYKVAPKELDLADEVIEVIETNCGLPGFREYMRLGDGRLVIQVKGVFFFFAPNVNY
jgi:hypothetical protein